MKQEEEESNNKGEIRAANEKKVKLERNETKAFT